MRRTWPGLGSTAALVFALGFAATATATPPAADDRSVPFGRFAAWLAIRGRSAEQIAAALNLTDLRPSTWKDGLAAANAAGSRTVFLTPDVHGWTLVVSAAFFARVQARPPDFPGLTRELSETLDTEVQFFAEDHRNLAEDLCAWARARGGTTLRAFSCFRTRQRAVDVGTPHWVDPNDADARNTRFGRREWIGAAEVMEVAADWSIDPSPPASHRKVPPERRIPAVVPRGFLAELPVSAPSVAARPRFELPEWIRQAAATVARPAPALDAACRRGEAAACGDRAFLLLSSAGGDESLARAAALAGQACEGGSARACALRGWMVRRGVGTSEDRAAALPLFDRACQGGHAPGCFLLGVSLQRGEGGSPVRSHAWDAYERSCAGGYTPACAQTDFVGKREGPPAVLPSAGPCKGERIQTVGIGNRTFLELLDRIRTHVPLEAREVEDAARWQARILRNAVLASHGRAFESRDLRAFFSGFSWYRPTAGEVDGRLSAADRKNIALLLQQEACAEPGDYLDDEQGDWRLVEIYLAEDDIEVPEHLKSVIGVEKLCPFEPAEGCPTIEYHSNGRVIHRETYGSPSRIGSWRVEGKRIRVRYFAEMRVVGEGFSPAEPGDEDDEEPIPGVWKLFVIERAVDE